MGNHSILPYSAGRTASLRHTYSRQSNPGSNAWRCGWHLRRKSASRSSSPSSSPQFQPILKFPKFWWFLKLPKKCESDAWHFMVWYWSTKSLPKLGMNLNEKTHLQSKFSPTKIGNFPKYKRKNWREKIYFAKEWI